VLPELLLTPSPRGDQLALFDGPAGGVLVAAGLDPEHGRSGHDRPGAQLRTREVHHHPALLPYGSFRAAQVLDHALPGARVVVSTVDARAVHAALQEAAHERVVVGSFARHRHEDAHAPLRSLGAEQRGRVLVEERPSVVEARDPARALGEALTLPRETTEDREHGFQRAHRVRLGPPERRESEVAQGFLQRPHVAAAQGQIVEEVARAVLEGTMDARGALQAERLEAQHVLAQRHELADRVLEQGVGRTHGSVAFRVDDQTVLHALASSAF
jgi:hypothetical protein